MFFIKSLSGPTTTNSKGQTICAKRSTSAKNALARGAWGVILRHEMKAKHGRQLGQLMCEFATDEDLEHIEPWKGRIKNEMKVTDKRRNRRRMVMSVSKDPQDESKPIIGVRFAVISDVLDRLKTSGIVFGKLKNNKSIYAQLHTRMTDCGFKKVEGPSKRDVQIASSTPEVMDSFEYIYVHPLFDVNKPELIRKIVQNSVDSQWSYDSL